MKKIEYIIKGLLIILILGSCSDFLEEKSQDEVLVKSIKDYREMLLNYTPYANSFNFYTLFDDDIELDDSRWWGDREDYNAKLLMGSFTWQADMWERNENMGDIYLPFYKLIMGTNAVIEGIMDAEGNQEEKELIKADALGLRGFYYLTLVNLFAEPYNINKDALGIPVKIKAAIIGNGMKRNSVSEVYAQITNDFETASEIFAKYGEDHFKTNINKTAIDILLSRTYLYMEEWDKVIETANRAMKSSKGLTDYTQIDGNLMMPSYENTEVAWIYGNFRWNNSLKASQSLKACYNKDDCRLKQWFGYGMTKFKTKEWGEQNITVRISEAYLNRAEAMIMKNTPNFENARKDLIELRKHRIKNYEDEKIANEQLSDEIKLERRREFCYDGLRWFDLRRYGMHEIRHNFRTRKIDPIKTYILKEKDPCYTLPIPAEAIDNNILLKQNPSGLMGEREGISLNNK